MSELNPRDSSERCLNFLNKWDVQTDSKDGFGNPVNIQSYELVRSDEGLVAFGATSKGRHQRRVEKDNEDALNARSFDTPNGMVSVFVVTDGVGGRADGGEAALIVAGEFAQRIGDNLNSLRGNNAGSWFEDRALETNQYLTEQRPVPGLTTAVVAIVEERTGKFLIANFGDSGASLVRAQSSRRITDKHEHPQDGSKYSGAVHNVFCGKDNKHLLAQEDLDDLLRRGKTLGARIVSFGALGQEDALVLYTDGIDPVGDQIYDIFKGKSSRQGDNLAFRLVDLANRRSGNDNATAIVIWRVLPKVRPQRTAVSTIAPQKPVAVQRNQEPARRVVELREPEFPPSPRRRIVSLGGESRQESLPLPNAEMHLKGTREILESMGLSVRVRLGGENRQFWAVSDSTPKYTLDQLKRCGISINPNGTVILHREEVIQRGVLTDNDIRGPSQEEMDSWARYGNVPSEGLPQHTRAFLRVLGFVEDSQTGKIKARSSDLRRALDGREFRDLLQL